MLYLGLIGFLILNMIGLFNWTKDRHSMKVCVFGLLMAYSSRVLHLASFLWASNGNAHTSSEWMWLFTHLITFGTTFRIVQGNLVYKI